MVNWRETSRSEMASLRRELLSCTAEPDSGSRSPRPCHSCHKQDTYQSTGNRTVSGSVWVSLVLFALILSMSSSPVYCQEQAESESPFGVSLAVVFDITGSMYDDLLQVIKGAAEILQDALTRREKALYNYVLVPFHDPVVGPALVTTDPDKFQADLKDLYVQGGGDCPEMSVGAIKLALEVSLPFSFIYVFTDARSKDYYLKDEVLSLIQQKQSQVVFVLTGDCGNSSHEGYRTYEEIAATSSGQVFLLKKSQVNQVLNFVRVAVQARKVNLLAINQKVGMTQVLNLPLDSHLKEVTVSVSGENPKIFLRDPEGKKVSLGNGLTELLSLSNVQIVNIKEPDPGNWRLRVSSSGPHTVRVTGLSSADFVAGFSKQPTKDLSQTSLRPIQGIPTQVLINSTGIESPSKLNHLELVDLEGTSLARYPLVQDPDTSSLYNVSAFIPPEKFFYVRVTGTDNQGFVMQRTTPTAISPIQARPPYVTAPNITHGFFDTTAVITCQVVSLLPYTVQWWYKNKQLGYDLYLNDSANVTLNVPRASSFSEGDYTCNVTSTAGSQSASTFLDISDPPPVILPPQNVSVLPGEVAVLSCLAFSSVPYIMTWKRSNHYGSLSLDPRIRIFPNDSLVIRNVDRHDEGSYNCTATNEGGSVTESLVLKLKVAPVAQITPREQTFVTGSSRQFTCIAGGYPEPSFIWQQDGEVLPTGGRYQVDGGHISFKNLKPSDEGEYECLASNSAGTASVKSRLVYTEAPRVREFERKLLVAVGDDAKMSCISDGIPRPNITWFRSDRKLQPAYNVDVTAAGVLIISDVMDSDAGEYRCLVQNEAGSDSALLTLEVGSAPEIVQAPENMGIDIETNGTLPCQAVGRPVPKLSWRRGDGRPIDLSGRLQQSPTGSLEITNIQPADEGIYTCVAQNPFGVDEAAAFVSVTGIVRPLIAYTDPYVRVVEGDMAELECVVLLGKPKPRLSWLRNGRLLRESDKVHYVEPGRIVIADAREDDDGEYVCMASNIGGNETYTIELDVLVPPRLVTDNEEDSQSNFSVVQGHSVFLPCTVTADPPATYSWFKDGVPISATDIRYYIRLDGALEIFSADVQDAASYKCVASNLAGEVEKNMNLFVEVAPSIVGNMEETFEVKVNESILLPCEVTGIPAPRVTWKQNFLPLAVSSPRIQLQSNGLYVSRAEISDKAIYECLASNIAGDANKVITLIVYEPPSIEPGLSTVVVLYGQTALLECESNGDPAPAVLWRKNGVILDINDPQRGYYLSPRGSLTISSAEIADAGSYTCTATNPAGTVSRDISLTVHGAPEIAGIYQEYQDVVEGNPVILPCPAVGTPRPEVSWYKDGLPLAGELPGLTVLQDGSLEIDGTTAADSGKYECVAENVAGIANRNFELKILVPPKLKGSSNDRSNPEIYKVIVDKNVTLNCPVSEDTDPPPVMTWLRDNQPITDDSRFQIADEGRSLTIVRAQVEDELRYRCIASNIAGEVQKNFLLDVQVPPSLDESSLSPTNQSVITGHPLYINCPIQGKPPPQVRWLKDGEPLTADLDPNVKLLAEGRRLELQNAKITDRGRYVCIGENVAGKTSRDFTVNVFVPPTVEEPSIPERTEVVEGNSVRLTCPASGIPIPRVSWFRQEVPIKANTSKLTLLDSGWTLEIKDSNSSDAARYYCRAENVAGQAEKVFDLEVLLKPSINRQNLDFKPQVIVNNTAVINCPVSGNPTPEILWYKNGVLLDASINPRYEILGSGRQIRIYPAQVKDKGRYTCAATNRAGEDKADFDLDVLVPPKIEKQGINPHFKVIANSSVTLTCPVTATPPANIQWFKDGQLLDMRPGVMEARQNGTELVLLRGQVSDSGRYRCVASNPAGEDSLNLQLSVQVPPSIPLESIITNPNVIEGETTILHCPAQGVPEPSVLWFVNGVPLDTESPGIMLAESGRKIIINPSKVSSAGVYTCIAANEAGEAEQIFELTVWVPPVIDRSALEANPRVVKSHIAVINCPVSGIPFPLITWTKEGVPVETSSRIQIISNGLQLRILDAQEADAASYSCLASNPAGTDQADFALVVLVPPTIDESNVVYDRKVNMGRRVELECPVHGIPPPAVQWMVNAQPVENFSHIRLLSDNRILEVNNVGVADTAFYTCTATNEAGQLERNFNLEVLVPPTIDRSGIQTNVAFIHNQTVKLFCPTSGIPEPDVLWMKEQVPLLDAPHPRRRLLDDGQTLELSSISLNDAGNYSCRASNPAGQDQLDFVLHVLVPPTISKPTPDRLHVIEGQTISMRCTVTGTPEPSILWLKDGAVIIEQNGHKQVLDQGRTLQIVDAHPVDTARYTCHAENQAGFAEKYFDLEVYEPARINGSGQRVDVAVTINQEVVLSCPANGLPPPTISWLRKNVPIPSYGMPNIRIQDNGRQLVIISAQLLDFGEYSCQASNAAGNDRLQFNVIVMVPPEIESAPTEVAEIVSGRTVLQCETSGQPTPTVSWTKNTNPFPSTGLRHRMLPSGSLEFMIVRLEDQGTYQCTASNPAGNASHHIEFTVQIPAKIVSKGQNLVRVSEREPVTLSCDVQGSPRPTLYWLKNRQYVENDTRITVMENGSLYISKTDRADSAVYTCLAQNSAGTDNRDIRLRVQEPPEIHTGQKEFTVLQNRTIVLPCQVSGRPKPKIRWEKDGQEVTSPSNHRLAQGSRVHYITLQTGGLAIPHTRAEDAGNYTCVAENSAGESRQTVSLKVQVPPFIEGADSQYVVSVGQRISLPCVTVGLPTPVITWIRDRRRIDPRDPKYTIGSNGSLTIEDIHAGDTGSYVCTAENPVGTDSQSRILRVQVPPEIVTPPKDRELTVSSTFQMNCVAKGLPTPTVTWTLNGRPLAAPPSINGVSTITIRNAMKEDAGEYTCVATNPANDQKVTASARVLIKVPPVVIIPPGDWAVRIAEKVVLDCSVGGDPVPDILWTKNSRPVELTDRIQQLSNGSLVIYDLTASDAAIYKCIAVNDAGTSEAQSVVTVKSEPKFKIEPADALVELGQTVMFDCTAEGVPTPVMSWWKETEEISPGGRLSVFTNNSLRIIATQQSDAGLYRCLASNPLGKTFVETHLNVVVHGEFSPWGEWSPCSLSCGWGERSRQRACDRPAPQNGGRDCLGSRLEYTRCLTDLCPVNGNWGPWNAWSECSLTCGGGQRGRERACSNPPPSGSGQPCLGSGEEIEYCNSQGCPVDGSFSEWSAWSRCSRSCGPGTKERFRQCRRPLNGGRGCVGDTSEIMDCQLGSCFTTPVKAEGNLIGYINNVDIADSTIVAQMTPVEGGSTRVEATVRNVPPAAANYLQHLISLLTPVYWTTAQEVDGAYNGYTLTRGEFMREVQVEFATGEILKMSHYANGVDSKGTLLFDIIIRGEVPDLGQVNQLQLTPYQEEYIQTGPGTVYAHSSRLLNVDGISLPYAWNHTITYDENQGRMPYLVQQLSSKNLVVEMLPSQQSVRYRLDAFIRPGIPSNRCPTGFQHDTRDSFCRDDDECAASNPCSHNCHNTPGSFSCSCPAGFLLASDARVCQDINECVSGAAKCDPAADCLNTPGSFRCISRCSQGFERDRSGENCVDINECQQSPSVCEQTCQNLVGSYRCSCLPGYRLGENGRCSDINECQLGSSPCSHDCTNTPGSYRCSCPVGFQLHNNRICQDIDECSTGQHRCFYNQRCINLEGGYRCDCPAGFTSRGPGQPCVDVDECVLTDSVCTYRCRNTWGGYECLCPPGQLQLADRKSCAGLEFLEPGRVLPISDDQTFSELLQAQEEWMLAPISQPSTRNPRTRLPALKKSTAPAAQVSNLSQTFSGTKRRMDNLSVLKEMSPKFVETDEHVQTQALTMSEMGTSNTRLPGSDRTYTYHSPWRTLKVPTKYQRYLSYSNSQQLLRHRRDTKTKSLCPSGMMENPANKTCIDKDECSDGSSHCQHNCTNTKGSYICTCPAGYRLHTDEYSCQDVNECTEHQITCGPEKMCFNQRGSYSCIDIPCPTDYARDPTTNFCVLECVDPNIPCPPGAKYADVIEFRTIALPGGNPARQDLIRLTAYNQHDEYLPQTVFVMLQNDPQLQFHLRIEEGRGIVYTLEPLTDSSTYRITVRARSYDHHRRHIQYQTTFIIHISVSAFPY